MKRLLTPTITLFLFFFAAVGGSPAPAIAQTAPDGPEFAGATGLGFGGAAAVGDSELFVGVAPTGWPRGDDPAGHVYHYVLDGTEWMEHHRIRASDGALGDDFGRTVYTHGDLLVIGAPGAAAAYVFRKGADGMWKEEGKLTPAVLPEGFEFAGQSARGAARTENVAVVAGHVAVTSFDSDKNEGMVHIFGGGTNGWTETAVLKPAVPQEGDGFGMAITAHANWVAVGAPLSDDKLGAVYVFDINPETGAGTQSKRITLVDEDGPAALGASLKMHLVHLVVGAPLLERKGALFAFDGANDWAPMAKMEAPTMGEEQVMGFGNRLAISNADVVVAGRGGSVLVSPFALEPTFQLISPPDDRRRPGFGSGLAIHGDVMVVGSPTADYEAGVATVYERSAASGAWVATKLLASDVSYLDAVTGEQVDCQDGSAGAFDCSNVDLMSFLPLSDLSSDRGVGATDIWGWTDPETGKEWVLFGRTEGVSFVDISNPGSPLFVGQLPMTAGANGSSWRDVKVYKDHAYVVSDGAGEHGVQVFDLRRLRNVEPEDMPRTFRETAIYDGIASSHNIVINEETGFAYTVGNRGGGNTCAGQLHMIDIREPGSPKFAGCFSAEGLRGTHDSQCVIYRGDDVKRQGREICLNSTGQSFVIADVTDKDNPETLANTTYPNQAYTHQGWLSEDHNYFYMNDELDEMYGLVDKTRTLIWDVRDLNDPVLVTEYYFDNGASDHNLYVRDNYMYQSNYQAGLRILDITDPENPVEVAWFDTAPNADNEAGFGGSWSNYPYFKSGVIAVSSRGEGLFLVKMRELDM